MVIIEVPADCSDGRSRSNRLRFPTQSGFDGNLQSAVVAYGFNDPACRIRIFHQSAAMLGMNDFFAGQPMLMSTPIIPVALPSLLLLQTSGDCSRKLHEQRLFGGIIIKFGPYCSLRTRPSTLVNSLKRMLRDSTFDNLSVGGIRHPVHQCQANYRTLDFRPAHANIRG